MGPAAGKCLGVYPPITGIYVAAGDKAKESDRASRPNERNEFAFSVHLVYSVRLNFDRLLKGETIVASQYPDETLMRDLDQASFVYPSGQLVTVPGNEFEEVLKIEEERKKQDAEWKAGRKEKFREMAEQKKLKDEEDAKRKAEEEQKQKDKHARFYVDS